MTTESDAEPMDARDIKEGDRMLIRYPDREDVTVVVEDVVEDEDGNVALTVTPV